MELELNKIYTNQLDIPSFWGLPEDYIIKTLSNGRQCGVLLEGVIANMFNGCDTSPAQGSGADIMWNGKTIQAKTARPRDHILTRGINKGKNELDVRNQWVSKSGLWDKTPGKQIPIDDYYRELEAYYDDYDYFMIINIAKFDTFYFEFITVDTDWIKNNSTKGRISWNEILKNGK